MADMLSLRLAGTAVLIVACGLLLGTLMSEASRMRMDRMVNTDPSTAMERSARVAELNRR